MNPLETFILSPVLPWWVLTAAGAAFALALWRTYGACPLSPRRRALLFALRFAAFLLCTWLLLLPSRRVRTVQREKPALAVVVDASASMRDNPLKAARTRAQAARRFLEDGAVRRRLADFRVRFFAVGGGAREFAGEAGEGFFTDCRTFLKSGLNAVADRLRAENLAGMVLLSDGLDQGDEPLDPRFAALPVFIPWLEPLPPPDPPRQDFALEKVSAPARISQGWEATITAGIRRRNGSAPQTFAVSLQEGGRTIRRAQVAFGQGQFFRKVDFPYQGEEPGPRLLRIAMDPEDDADPDDNARELVLEVLDARQNILYLEGVPRWEFKFLKRSLLDQRGRSLHACLQAGGGAFLAFSGDGGVRTLPEFTGKSLAEYRLVILGELGREALPREKAEALGRFVRKGGALLLLGGSCIYAPDGIAAQEPLKGLLPALPEPGGGMHEGRFAVAFTEEARTHQGLAALAQGEAFPPLLSLWTPVRKGPFASVWLAAADGSPALVTGRAGEGRVAMLFSDSLWRWQLGAAADSGADGGRKSLYARLMTQLVEWLIPGSVTGQEDGEIRQELSANQAELYGSLVVRAFPGKDVAASGLACRIRPPQGSDLVLPLQKDPKDEAAFVCRFVPDRLGVHRLECFNREGVRSRAALLPVSRPEFECTGAPCDRDALAAIAAESGGGCCEWEDRERMLARIPARPRTYESVQEFPVWNHWGCLALLIALLSLEWTLRRKWDLV